MCQKLADGNKQKKCVVSPQLVEAEIEYLSTLYKQTYNHFKSDYVFPVG